jgi:single-strand DNA-binding protein
MSTLSNNRVQLLGFIGQEVETREFAEGNKLARTSMATDEFKKSASGQMEKVTTWHNLIGWGQTAQQMSELLHKGQKAYVEGKIVYRKYETKTGEKRSQTEIVVSSFKKLEKDQGMPVENGEPSLAF